MVRHTDLVDRPVMNFKRLQPIGDQNTRFYSGARGDYGRPAAVFEAALGRQFGAHLAEHLRLEFGEVLDRSGHAAGGVVLGQAVGRENVGEDYRARVSAGGVVGIVVAGEPLAHRVRPLIIDGVLEGRFVRLVVSWEGSVGEACGHEDPPSSLRLHNEGAIAPDGILRDGVVWWLVVGAFGRAEVRHVVAGPLSLLFVPPDVFLLVGPGLAFGIGRGAVVDNAAVHRPRPRPLGGHPVLLGVWFAAGGLVGLVGVDASVDPAPARRRAVVLERQVAGESVALGVPTAYLPEDGLRVGLVVGPLRRVVPRQVQDGPVFGIFRVCELLPDLSAEVVHEPQLRAAVALGIYGFVMPLQEALGVGERAILLGVRGSRQEEDLGAESLGLQFPGLYLG